MKVLAFVSSLLVVFCILATTGICYSEQSFKREPKARSITGTVVAFDGNKLVVDDAVRERVPRRYTFRVTKDTRLPQEIKIGLKITVAYAAKRRNHRIKRTALSVVITGEAVPGVLKGDSIGCDRYEKLP